MRIWAAVSAGGALGALARYALAAGWPDRPGGFPWATFVINVSGCLLIGAVLALVGGDARVARAFLAPGVLGGYTTFSAYALDAQRLLAGGHAGTAAAYVAGTLVAALAAVAAGSALGSAVESALGSVAVPRR